MVCYYLWVCGVLIIVVLCAMRLCLCLGLHAVLVACELWLVHYWVVAGEVLVRGSEEDSDEIQRSE